MATRSAIYEMDKVERNRLRLVTARLAKRLGIDEVKPADRARQPELARVYELRTFNDFLEGVDASLKDEGYSAAAGESKADAKEAADAANPAADASAASVKAQAKKGKA